MRQPLEDSRCGKKETGGIRSQEVPRARAFSLATRNTQRALDDIAPSRRHLVRRCSVCWDEISSQRIRGIGSLSPSPSKNRFWKGGVSQRLVGIRTEPKGALYGSRDGQCVALATNVMAVRTMFFVDVDM